MELKISHRKTKKKNEVMQARRAGLIPAIVYKQGKEGESIIIESAAFGAFLRKLKPGHLPTTRLKLVDEQGKVRQAIIKDIQYHPTTYNVLHLDFLELVEDAEISVKVPIECIEVPSCVGIKQGGVLRQVLRYARVRCLPKHLPESFSIDVKEMGIGQVRRLRDLVLAKGVQLLDNMTEVAVVIAKR